MKKKNSDIIPNNSFTEFLLYTTSNGKVKVEIFLRDENIWLTQARIGELFGVDRTVVTKHLQNIYSEGELCKNQTSAKIARVQNEGKKTVTREVEFYNLDAILSVGYRVNSSQATHFRIWAQALAMKEYEIYKNEQDKLYESDFDREVKKILNKSEKINPSDFKKKGKNDDG
jgi:hypothetical protein